MKIGKGSSASTDVARQLHSHEDVDNHLLDLVERAGKILHSQRPKQHKDFKIVIANLNELTRLSPQNSEVHFIVSAALGKLNDA